MRAQPEIQAGVDSSPFFGHQRIGAIAIAMTSPNQGVPRPQPGHTPHNPASGGSIAQEGKKRRRGLGGMLVAGATGLAADSEDAIRAYKAVVR